MDNQIQNQLSTIRQSRGLAAADLARRVGVSRQTIYAIEAGSFVPNTEVTLKLARELEVQVEELFSLNSAKLEIPSTMQSDLLCATPIKKGQAVRICQVGSRRVSIPVDASPYYLPEADGVISRLGRSTGNAEIASFSKEESHSKKLVLAGCDPAIGLLSSMVGKWKEVEIVSAAASSKLALQWLKEGKVHIAGSHLEDPKTGEFNLPYLRQEFPDDDFAVISFAQWEEGLVTAAGNPKNLRKVEDLARKSVRFVNRESGSGSRALLDRLLKAGALPSSKVSGYSRIAYGHLAVAYLVLIGEVDCCLATRSAAQAFQLDFVPLQSERYDFVMRRETLAMPLAQTFLDVLQRATLRRKLEVLAGYDTSQTGVIIA